MEAHRYGLSAAALKYLAALFMLVDHIGMVFPTMLTELGLPTWADGLPRLIGRLAFPIFCFLAVEGFLHTHDVKKYVRRLLLFGLLSEVPFDLAFFRTPFAPQHQNVYWTLALGVLAMAGLKRFEKENGLPGWQGLAAAPRWRWLPTPTTTPSACSSSAPCT